ncbi:MULTISPECIES: DEAD/DEAH box helicase [unclassified Frondihabitans]|uniref:DEAD/DEAH box helicase n=1 Tax=unclassified Frondihabitans TaxID=2626248 RepID=UPI000F4EFA2B|nr:MULTISPECIES: DEAD/DEAH box helicase [unclassified Frondihabitans]RPE78247.1 superfamily II DNA/RNA helicase [Frondihabitans sp. PhB153]RPF08528.1 superfamily II DNA/RNA helicase [Frondihabitans sp. PhB161]
MSPYDKSASSRPKGERPGSKSPKHRGFRAQAEGGPAKKRWDAPERAARAEGRSGGRDAGARDGGARGGSARDAGARGGSARDSRGAGRDASAGRPNWEPRKTGGSNPRFGGGARDDRDARNGARGGDRFDRNDRFGGGRPSRDDRPARDDRPSRDDRFGGGRPARDDRAPRDDRGGRSYDRSDRPARDDRAPRSFDRGDRPARSYDRPEGGRPGREDRAPFKKRDDYGQGRPARDDHAPRSNDRGDRPARDDRAPRSFDRNDRPARSFDRDSRPARDDRAPRSFDRNDRPARSFDRDSRPARDDRAPRSFDRSDRTERPARSFDRTERPARSFDRTERPARSFDGDDRPSRSSDYYPKRDSHFTPEDDVKLEKLQAEVVTAGDVAGKTWGDLGLGDNLTRQLIAMGAPSPFPIQAATIPDVIAGKDVLGRGRTGSGKTIAFGAPLAEKLLEHGGAKDRKMGRKPRALILAPTRELAMQIDDTVQPIARSVGLFTTQIYGGVPQQRQVHSLQRGVDIVIGTPGRIEDLIEQGRLDLSEVTVTVLDEADHMCDLGFLEPVQRILRETAAVTRHGARAQKLLFSATLDKGVAKLVDEFLTDPAVHEVAGEDQASATIDHRVLLIDQRDKGAIIEQLAQGKGKTLVFARTRAFAEQLADQLEDAGIASTSLHGDLNQSRRTRNLQLLTSGRVNVLVATDVAARGIHVDDIELVIQADAPDEYKTYMHRSGRTGRAGKEGTVVTLITRARRRRMEELLDRAEITAEMVEARPGDRLIDQLAGV